MGVVINLLLLIVALLLLKFGLASNPELLVPLHVQVDQRGDEVGQTGAEEDKIEDGEVHIELDKGAHFPDQTRIVLDHRDCGQDDHHN